MDEPIRVLLVDDATDILDALVPYLQRRGYDPRCASNGIEGLEMASELKPDVMVIDVCMPGLDGLQLVRALRGDPATADIALVILSAMSQDSHVYRGHLSGADQYLTKPVDPAVLTQTIQNALLLSEQARAQRMHNLV
jgi:DNA-binding response OmpR family regulator